MLSQSDCRKDLIDEGKFLQCLEDVAHEYQK